MALRVWNLESDLVSSLAGGSLSMNAILPIRYRAWQWVGSWISRALRTDFSDEKFHMSWIPISSKRCQSGPKM